MSNIVPILGNGDPSIVLAAIGVGASSITFLHNTAAEGNYTAQLFPATFLFAVTDIVGVFSGLAVNLEWSPITSTGTPQFQTIGTWTPLTSPTAYFPCSSTGQYRLNVTSFTGGTSFNVYCSIAATMPQGVGGSGGGGSVTQGTVPWIVAFSSAQHVIVDSGAGAGTQFADNAASGATPTGTLSMGWDSVNSKVRALKVDASQNLLVDVSNASIAVTGTFFQATQPVSIAASVAVTGTFFQATQPISGTVAVSNPDAQFADNAASGATPTGTLSMAWDSVNSKIRALKIDASQNLLVDVSNASIAVTGTFFQVTQPVSIAANVGVTQQTTPWLIQGNVADGSTTETNILVVGGESNDATAQYQPLPLGTVGRSVIIEGFSGGTAVPISGSVSVSNFPATQPVSGTVTANQGTANTLANAWPQKITDGTNGPVAVKPASTPAVATDPALVVAISPNNPITTSLPSNAAQEVGGNLAVLYTMAMNLTSILAQLKLLNLNLASSMPSAYVDQDTTLIDTMPTIN